MIQKFLQIVALTMLSASQGFAVYFCDCADELFSNECPCVESHCEHNDPCEDSSGCVTVIEFDFEDYVSSQISFSVSNDSVGIDLPRPSPVAGFDDLGTTPFLNFSHASLRLGEPSGENRIFAEFINLRV